MSQYDKNYNTTYKVLVLGESGVGKTSIIRRFTDEKYQESYISTIGLYSLSIMYPSVLDFEKGVNCTVSISATITDFSYVVQHT